MNKETKQALDLLTDEVHRLDALLQDPEPGLSMWWDFVGNRLQTISDVFENMKRHQPPPDRNPIV